MKNFLIGFLLLFAPLAQADVSLRNGNFFIGYTDIVYPGGFEPKIERVYNSKTAYRGIYGWGWGTEYEAYLTVSADGSVVVHEYGGGAENRFSPREFDQNELAKAIDLITGAAQKAGILGSSKTVDGYRRKLKEDAPFRNDEWEKFIAQGRLQPRQLKAGVKLFSNNFSYQFITRVANGYTRAFDSGKIEVFNESGKLIEVKDRNSNFVKFDYDKNGKISKLTDNFNRKMFFTFNSQGLLSEIKGENNKVAKFDYNSNDELIKSQDVDAHLYKFKYSGDRRHNLTQITYSDNTTMDIDYYPRSEKENVRKIKDRDGTLTEYRYQNSSKDQLVVSVNVTDKDGKRVISKSEYSYWFGIKPSGEEWTKKMVTVFDGDRTETVYNERFGLPDTIKKGGEVTRFKYDDKGRVTNKVTPYEVTDLNYHPQFGKVTRVVASRPGAKSKKWSDFKYDTRGNLETAVNSDKKSVRLFYDRNGRISSMVDQDKRRIDFEYNENSKPVVIRDPKLNASITVSYTNSGEVKKVESTAGRKIAIQVTSAFQNLLEIIQPAGVTLSF